MLGWGVDWKSFGMCLLTFQQGGFGSYEKSLSTERFSLVCGTTHPSAQGPVYGRE